MALQRVASFWKSASDKKSVLSGQIVIGDLQYPCYLLKNDKKKDTHPDYKLVYDPEKGEPAFKFDNTEEKSKKELKSDDDVPF